MQLGEAWLVDVVGDGQVVFGVGARAERERGGTERSRCWRPRTRDGRGQINGRLAAQVQIAQSADVASVTMAGAVRVPVVPVVVGAARGAEGWDAVLRHARVSPLHHLLRA